jgi:hypothetical protein
VENKYVNAVAQIASVIKYTIHKDVVSQMDDKKLARSGSNTDSGRRYNTSFRGKAQGKGH